MTQLQVAEKLGISDGAYKNYEQGKREPNGDTIVELANMFDVTTDYLLGRVEPDEKPDPLKVLSKQQNMDEVEEIFLQKYLAMPKEGRDAVIEMMHSVIEVFRRNDMQKTITVKTAARAGSGGEHKPIHEEEMTLEEVAELFNGEDATDL